MSLPRTKETRKGNLYFLLVKIYLFLKLSTYRITKVCKVHLTPPESSLLSGQPGALISCVFSQLYCCGLEKWSSVLLGAGGT